jgi:hypothetical protein
VFQECEVFSGQDKDDPIPAQYSQPMHAFSFCNPQEPMMDQMNPGFAQSGMGGMVVPQAPVPRQQVQDSTEKRVTIWHKKEKRKISGNAAPMEKNLRSYLATHPECEVYTNQDKGGDGMASPSVTAPDQVGFIFSSLLNETYL